VVFKRLGLGRRTRQYNPAQRGATSLGQWLTAVFAMKGQSHEMTVPAAVEMIRATPPARRSEFASEIWAKRRERGTDHVGEVNPWSETRSQGSYRRSLESDWRRSCG
jgi:hypothetical protein